VHLYLIPFYITILYSIFKSISYYYFILNI